MKKELIQYEDFSKLDLRVGEVTDAKPVEKSEKLLELFVDFGEDYGNATVLTGMAQFHTPEEFIRKKFVFVANLAPRKMMGKESQGMIMACDDQEKPILFSISNDVPNGTVIR